MPLLHGMISVLGARISSQRGVMPKLSKQFRNPTDILSLLEAVDDQLRSIVQDFNYHNRRKALKQNHPQKGSSYYKHAEGHIDPAGDPGANGPDEN